MLQTGSLLDGKYKILNMIGRGGMSTVYLAINERANKTWAVKEVRKTGGPGAETVTRGLIAETDLLKRLDHPNLPSIVDVIDQEDCFLIVMDYIEGTSLQDLLERAGPQPAEKVLEWARQLCDVLGYLHSRRPPVIYRDMKPANVMLRPNGRLALIDFGTAREYKYSGEEDTAWLGTRGYAAPEQFGNMGQTDGRTDIYALGATMFHLLTGRSPALLRFELQPVGNYLPELRGSGLEKLVLRCCRPDPLERYQSCEELMYALEHVHDGDDKVIRKRRLHWRLFASSLILAAALAISGFAFRTAWHGSREVLYERHMRAAREAESFAETAEACGEAMDLLPSREEAWNRLISSMEALPDISDEDYRAATACILSSPRSAPGVRPEKNTSRLQVLRRTRPALYADFNYRMAMAVFFNREGGGETASMEFFRNAIQAGALDGPAQETAAVMYSLADQYTRLREMEAGELRGEDPHIRSFEIERGYRECWQIFETMAGRLEEMERGTGNTGYPAAVCERIAEELQGDDLIRYAADGVSETSMRSTLQKIRTYLGKKMAAGQSENTKRRLEEVEKKVLQAEKAIDRAFRPAALAQ